MDFIRRKRIGRPQSNLAQHNLKWDVSDQHELEYRRQSEKLEDID